MSNQVAEVSPKYRMETASETVPVGYKQTEVGVIPEDWNIQKLGTHATFKTGPFGSALHKSDYVNDGIPVVNPMQIVDGKIEPTASMSISDEAARKLSDFRLINRDIIIGRRGDMGRCAVISERESGWLCGTGSMIIRVKESADARFLQRFLSSPKTIAAIESASVGTTMINLNQGTLRELQVVAPCEKQEQTAIANALSDVDALISELEKLIAKKQAIKTATMQQLLTGRTRLPQFALREDGTKKGTKSSELGEIPEDWEVVEFSSIVWFQEGPGVRQYQFTSAGIKLLNGTNIENGSLLLEKTQRFISEKLAYGQYSHFMIDAGDILIACSGVTIERFDEKVTVVSNEDLPLCLNTSTMRFKVRSENTDKIFIKNFLKSSFFKDQIGGKATGSAQLNFGPYHVNQVKIAVPNKEEQTAIATILSDMDAEIQTLEQRLGKTRQIKQGMMQELLTGKTRLIKEVPNE